VRRCRIGGSTTTDADTRNGARKRCTPRSVRDPNDPSSPGRLRASPLESCPRRGMLSSGVGLSF
jgi:hypothetical protein